MRLRHFETLAPVCPVCLAAAGDGAPASELPPLVLADVFTAADVSPASGAEDEVIVEGILCCPRPECLREYPILDGVPLLLPRIRAWFAANLLQVLGREDLAPELAGLVGDCLGPGSAYDTLRQQVASYAWDHYGDLDGGEPEAGDPEEAETGALEQGGEPAPGGVLRLLDRGLALLGGGVPPGPVLDLGCAVGRTSLHLAGRYEGPEAPLVLGIDLHHAMLRIAQGVLRTGEAVWERRRVGMVYDRRETPVSLPGADRVDYWACDATALPFAPGTFALAASLNVLDCVASPRDALASLARVLAPGGRAVLSTPYDWSPGATPVEGWLGGHSQRGPWHGAGEPVLRALLTPGAHPAAVPGLRILAEENLPWRVRLHDRSAVDYRTHLLALAKEA